MPLADVASLPPALEALALQRTVLDNGLVFHHAEAGEGAPLVFLHGVLGDWRTWAPQWAAFVPHFRCISYSRRYSVPNGNRAVSPDHSALAEADDLQALLVHWRAAPAVLVGASYGAYTALALAARRPEQVRALVLVEPPLMKLADATSEGRAIRSDFDQRIRLPARQAFEAGDDARAVWLLTEGILGGTDLGQQSTAAMGRRLENAESLRRVTLSSDEFPALDMDRLAALRSTTWCSGRWRRPCRGPSAARYLKPATASRATSRAPSTPWSWTSSLATACAHDADADAGMDGRGPDR